MSKIILPMVLVVGLTLASPSSAHAHDGYGRVVVKPVPHHCPHVSPYSSYYQRPYPYASPYAPPRLTVTRSHYYATPGYPAYHPLAYGGYHYRPPQARTLPRVQLRLGF